MFIRGSISADSDFQGVTAHHQDLQATTMPSDALHHALIPYNTLTYFAGHQLAETPVNIFAYTMANIPLHTHSSIIESSISNHVYTVAITFSSC